MPRVDEVHCGALTLAGWSDAAHEGRTKEGRRPLGYVVGCPPASLSVPRHLLRWSAEFTRKLVKCCLGSEVLAFSGTMGHMALLREFGFAPCVDPPPAMSWLGVCECLFTSSKNGRRVRGTYLIHQSTTTQHASRKA